VIRYLGIAICAFVLFPAAVCAHHSVVANYDFQSSIEVRGTIKEIAIRNPHSQLLVDVAGPDGEIVTWMVEWSDRNALIRREVQFERLRVGDEITITGLEHRRLAHVIYFRQAVLSDGAVLTDCGFGAFRTSILQGTEYTCEVEE